MTPELTRPSQEGAREQLAPHEASRRVLIVEDEKRLRENALRVDR